MLHYGRFYDAMQDNEEEMADATIGAKLNRAEGRYSPVGDLRLLKAPEELLYAPITQVILLTEIHILFLCRKYVALFSSTLRVGYSS